MTRTRHALTCAVAVVAVFAAACGNDTTDTTTTTEAAGPTPDSTWTGIGVLCGAGAEPGEEIERGVPIEVDETIMERCTDTAGNPVDIELDDMTRTWLFVPTGSDRDDAEYVFAERDGDTVTVTISHTRPADNCAVTMEYRGALGVVLVANEADAERPQIVIEDNPVDC